jgi:hypothetical protein
MNNWETMIAEDEFLDREEFDEFLTRKIKENKIHRRRSRKKDIVIKELAFASREITDLICNAVPKKLAKQKPFWYTTNYSLVCQINNKIKSIVSKYNHLNKIMGGYHGMFDYTISPSRQGIIKPKFRIWEDVYCALNALIPIKVSLIRRIFDFLSFIR